MARVVPKVLAALSVAFIIADVTITAQYRRLLSEEAVAQHGFPFLTLALVATAVLGAVILDRHPRHAVGWLLTGIGFIGSLSVLAEAFSLWIFHGGPGFTALAGYAGWVSSLLGGHVAIAGLALIFLIAPDGQPLSRRWRWVAVLPAAGVAACTVGLLRVDPATFDLRSPSAAIFGPLYTAGLLAISGSLIPALTSMLLRLRRSRGVERQQVRLIAIGAALVVCGVIILFTVQALNGGRQTWSASVPFFASVMVMPLLHAAAVLRYRLHDVELIVNRTLILALGTGFAAIGYTTAVVVVGELVGPGGGDVLLSLLATALVALAFQPLRRAIVRAADRVAYGPRAVPYQALADFSGRLSDVPTLATLLPAVAEATGRAVAARGVRVELRGHGDEATASAVWAEPWAEQDDGPTERIPVRSEDSVLAMLVVSLPRGRSLRESDARLLAALADQAAVALRNTLLEAQLARRVADLDATTRLLQSSRSRIVRAEDNARRDLQAAISRDVLPYLHALPRHLGHARDAVLQKRPDHGVELLVDGTTATLESLRDLTRGVFPTQLARLGIEPAVRALISRCPHKVQWLPSPSLAGIRFPARVEAAVYDCCARALRGGATGLRIGLDDSLRVDIVGASLSAAELQSVSDRTEAAGGQVSTTPEGLTLILPKTPQDEAATSPAH